MLTIAESLILLGTDDEKGTKLPEAGSKLDYGLVGAILAELTIQERIRLEDGGVSVINDSLTDIPYFNSVITEIKDEGRKRTVSYWLEKLSGRNDEINDPIYLSLVGKGILKEEGQSYLLIFNKNVYPTVDEGPEEDIKGMVSRIIFGNKKPGAESAMLLSLVYTCGLIEEVFGSDNKEVEKRIKDMVENNEYGEEVKQSVEKMETEILSGVTMMVTPEDTSKSV